MPKPVEKIPLVVDNREQVTWDFNPELFACIRGTLTTGDYAPLGMEDVISLERKTLGDAVNTLIHGFTRFRKELYRLAAMDHAALVIEASIEDIWLHKYESDAEPLAVIGRLNGVMIDHGIPVIMAGSRAMAMLFAERFIIQAVKKCGGVP